MMMDYYDIVTITAETADSFSPLIPVTLLDKLLQGKILGLGRIDHHMATGVLLFHVEDYKVNILSLYVDENQRRKGIGRSLLEKLCCIVRKIPGIDSVHAVLQEKCFEAEAFCKALGIRLEIVEGEAKFPLSLLKESILMKIPENKYCITGDKISRAKLTEYQNHLKKEGDYMLEGDLWSDFVSQSLSLYYTKEDEIQGSAVISHSESGLRLAMLTSHGDVKIPPILLGNLAHILLQSYPEETMITVETVTESTKKLLEQIVPAAVRQERKSVVLPLVALNNKASQGRF